MLGVGEFYADRFGSDKILYFYFICATVFTQLMFVNMLVGVMASSLTGILEVSE